VFLGGSVNDSIVEISVLAPPVDADNPKWKKAMDLLVGVVEQDFAIGEQIQRNFESGAVREVVYGRYEPALETFPSVYSQGPRRITRRALGK